jgi:hypothetical protein
MTSNLEERAVEQRAQVGLMLRDDAGSDIEGRRHRIFFMHLHDARQGGVTVRAFGVVGDKIGCHGKAPASSNTVMRIGRITDNLPIPVHYTLSPVEMPALFIRIRYRFCPECGDGLAGGQAGARGMRDGIVHQ